MDVVGVLANLYKGGVFYDNIVDDDTKKHQNHVNTAVVSYLPVYLGLLIADPEDEVRVAIATMISTFKDYEHSITPVILQVLNTEKTPRLRACFVRGLWELTSPDLRYVSLFISIFNSSQENESVRWASATNILESNNITRTVPVGDT